MWSFAQEWKKAREEKKVFSSLRLTLFLAFLQEWQQRLEKMEQPEAGGRDQTGSCAAECGRPEPGMDIPALEPGAEEIGAHAGTLMVFEKELQVRRWPDILKHMSGSYAQKQKRQINNVDLVFHSSTAGRRSACRQLSGGHGATTVGVNVTSSYVMTPVNIQQTVQDVCSFPILATSSCRSPHHTGVTWTHCSARVASSTLCSAGLAGTEGVDASMLLGSVGTFGLKSINVQKKSARVQ